MEAVGDYNLLKKIGTFSLGEIYLSKRKGTEEIFAIKKIGRNYIDKQGLSKIINKEISLSQNLKHQNICQYFGIILKMEKYYYLLMEYINGLTLSHSLEMYQYKHNAPFSEQIVQYLMSQIIDAFKLIHSKHITHRNINLDNIMVHCNDETDKSNLNLLKTKIKIIDFSLAQNDNLDKTVLGSPLYMSPELLKSLVNPDNNKISYDNKIDIWSLGAICYEMLTGKTVYDAQSLDDLVKKAEIGNYRIPNNLSLEAISFVYNMLRYAPNQRLSADTLAKHNFLTKDVMQFQRVNQNEEIILNTKQEKPQLRFDNQATQLNSTNNYANKENNINNVNYNNYINPINNFANGPNYNNIYYKNINPINNQLFQRQINQQNYYKNLGTTNGIQYTNIQQPNAYQPSQINSNYTNLGIKNDTTQQPIVYQPLQNNNNATNLGVTSQIQNMQNNNMQQPIVHQPSQNNNNMTKDNNVSNANQNSQEQSIADPQIIIGNNNNNNQNREQEQEKNEGKMEGNSEKPKLQSKFAKGKVKEEEKNNGEVICNII